MYQYSRSLLADWILWAQKQTEGRASSNNFDGNGFVLLDPSFYFQNKSWARGIFLLLLRDSIKWVYQLYIIMSTLALCWSCERNILHTWIQKHVMSCGIQTHTTSNISQIRCKCVTYGLVTWLNWILLLLKIFSFQRRNSLNRWHFSFCKFNFNWKSVSEFFNSTVHILTSEDNRTREALGRDWTEVVIQAPHPAAEALAVFLHNIRAAANLSVSFLSLE